MKADAIFINIGRGAIVNENDLVHALNTGQILACGLDVLEQEPIEEQHPLLKMPNVVIVLILEVRQNIRETAWYNCV